MILRRMAEAIRTQNWFTVIVEILIVVIGVFIGLQVQQWADERARIKQEATYMQRLHNEVIDLRSARQDVLQTRAKWHDNMGTALPVIFGEEDRALTDDECRGVNYNYLVSNPTTDIGSLLELQSSGRISIIQNEAVSKALQSFLLTRARASDSQAQISKLTKPIGPRFPQLIKVISPTIDTINGVEAGTFECDIEGMRADPAFKQDLELTQIHFGFHMGDNTRVSDSLEALHRVLDSVLGHIHEETAP